MRPPLKAIVDRKGPRSERRHCWRHGRWARPHSLLSRAATLLDPARLDRDRERQAAVQHAFEGLDTTTVESSSGFLVEQAQGALVRPRLAVDALRTQGVVDVAHGQDASLERERGGAVRIAAAVQPLVVTAHE